MTGYWEEDRRDYVEEEDPGDITDFSAVQFFDTMDSADIVLDESETGKQKEKIRNVVLAPRITLEDGIPKLSFKISTQGDRPMMLKKLRVFLQAVEKEPVFEISKTKSIDFSEADFTDESRPWLLFIQRRVGETDRFNDRIEAKTRYGYAPTVNVQNQEVLTGATSKERRVRIVHDFNDNDLPVFLISLKAGGMGLNLTGQTWSSTMIPGGTSPPRTRRPTAPTGSGSRTRSRSTG